MMNAAVERFVTDLNSILESDYGDFMRKANQQIRELRNEMQYLHYSDVDRKIEEIQNYVQFYPTWMIESTREKAIRDAKVINEMLMAHRQEKQMYH
jgi:hypothetical protein